ncbi:MAG TPA: response regulator [Gemmatimonadaceae bacterium]|nr:response regulator [Gemmatimonadaceae bacterium]
MTTPVPHAPAILVVDDDRDSADVLRTMLAARGYTVTLAHDGDDALRAFEELRPQLVLLDVRMPGRSGWEVCRMMKQHPEHGDRVRIIMLTALDGWTDKQEALRTGADDYVTKPVDLCDLGQRVERNLALLEAAS